VPIVRRPDPVPCAACATGAWDLCLNGRFTELGITGEDGMARTRFPLDPAFAVPVPAGLGPLAVLLEPASVVAKAWERVDLIRSLTVPTPETVLITGAGPVGLLAALLSRQRGHETHVLDLVTGGPKPDAVAAIGATYHSGPLSGLPLAPDVVIECTGVGSVVLDAIDRSGPNATVCLTGISSGARTIDFDAAAFNRRMVLENDVVCGSVNANRRHYESALAALVSAEGAWLRRLITRLVPVDRWEDALARESSDIKVCLDFTEGQPHLRPEARDVAAARE
jgi:glucose 1-dehydrogenase